MANKVYRAAAFLALLALLWTATVNAQPRRAGAVTEEAKAALAQLTDTYRSLGAYADHGQVMVAVTANGRETGKVRQMPLLFARPDQFAVNFGPLGLMSDGKSLLVIDYVHKNIYERPLTRAGLTTNPAALSAAQRQSSAQLLYYRDSVLTPGPKTDPQDLLGVIGAQMAGVVLTLLVDPDPVAALREGTTAVDVVAGAGGKRHLRFRYAEGPDLIIATNPQTKLIEAMQLVLPPAQKKALAPAKAELTRLQIEWQSREISRDLGRVREQLAREYQRLQQAPLNGFNRTTEMAVPEEARAPVPLPRGGRSLFDRLRRLIQALLG
jgi:hypothetical protein